VVDTPRPLFRVSEQYQVAKQIWQFVGEDI